VRAGRPRAFTRRAVGVSIGVWRVQVQVQARRSENERTRIQLPQCGCVHFSATIGRVEKKLRFLLFQIRLVALSPR
jgi:hypothetical protein